MQVILDFSNRYPVLVYRPRLQILVSMTFLHSNMPIVDAGFLLSPWLKFEGILFGMEYLILILGSKVVSCISNQPLVACTNLNRRFLCTSSFHENNNKSKINFHENFRECQQLRCKWFTLFLFLSNFNLKSVNYWPKICA